jgi:protease-4
VIPVLAAAAPVRGAEQRPPFEDFGRRDLLMGGPSTTDGSLGAFVNPAAWGLSGPADFTFWWNDDTVQENVLDNAGVSFGSSLGLTVQRFTVPAPTGRLRVQESQLGFSAGNRGGRFGAAWRWAGGDDEELKRESGAVLGAIVRPSQMVSFGISSFLSTESGKKEAIADVGVRPFGLSRFLVFGDYSLKSTDRPNDGVLSGGVMVRPIPGLHVGARVIDEEDGVSYVLQAGVYAGRLGAQALPRLDEDGDLGSTTMVFRWNPPIQPLPAFWRKDPDQIVLVDLENMFISYQRDLWFDDDRVAWIDLLNRLDEIEKDPRVAGIAFNLAGAKCRPSIAWELRQRMLRIRQSGRQVFVHLDRAKLSLYMLASAADHVTMDRAGSITLPGVALHRTYFHGLLDKLGLGFQEIRQLRYKSAFETFSKEKMSEEDREQYGRYVDVLYETIREEITSERSITEADFDQAVEEETSLTSAQAKERGFVDEIARWNDLKNSLKTSGKTLVEENVRERNRWEYEEKWGQSPKIVIVYADGEVVMDAGMHARDLAQHLHQLAERRDVRAIVLRVDSPGGDPLAADVVFDGMAACRRSGKPIIVTHGDLAASGGYFISLESDRIYTTPFTLTGSIGVIDGWVWDAGFSSKSGITADGVQRGSHADLYAGIRFPFVGARLPLRPMNEQETERAEETLLEIYDEFVSRVATARKQSEEDIEAIAQGRVWLGEDAIANGLCDEIGGLEDAVRDAKKRIGIAEDDEVVFEEYPKRKRFSLPKELTYLVKLGVPGWSANPSPSSPSPDYSFRFLEQMIRNAGEPLMLLPPDALPVDWDRPAEP